jgi:pimeloyl-ACP methyl ester carboxylesterase
VSIDGVDFAYRELGRAGGVPVIFLNHLAAVLDNWDPRVVDGIAAQRRVITFDIRASAHHTAPRRTPSRAMAHDAVAFIRALGGPDAGHGGIFQNHEQFVPKALDFLKP